MANSTITKKSCPVSREEFRAKAPRSLTVVINGVPHVAELKEFSTGSLGYNLSGKMTVMIGDTPCQVQIGVNLTLVGSKELPQV